jgi:hypothetical protein
METAAPNLLAIESAKGWRKLPALLSALKIF